MNGGVALAGSPASKHHGLMPSSLEIGSAADWFSGTMAAGAIITSLWLAGRSTREQIKRDQATSRQIAMKTTAKLLVVINNVVSSSSYISGCKPRDERQARGSKWGYITPVANMIDDQLTFDPDEFALLTDGGEVKLAMDVSLLFRRHAASIAAMRHYGAKREDLLMDLPAPFETDGPHAAVMVEGDAGRRLQVRSAALEKFLEGMILATGEDLSLANSVRDRIGPAFRKILGDPKFPRLGIPEAHAQ